MALTDLLYFENPEVFPVAAGLLLFILLFSLLRSKLDKGPAVIISFVFGLSAAAYLFKNPEKWENSVAFILIGLMALIVIFFIARAFFRFARHQFRH